MKTGIKHLLIEVNIKYQVSTKLIGIYAFYLICKTLITEIAFNCVNNTRLPLSYLKQYLLLLRGTNKPRLMRHFWPQLVSLSPAFPTHFPDRKLRSAFRISLSPGSLAPGHSFGFDATLSSH